MSDPSIYTVGWICAVETELVAAASFLDEEHDDPEYLPVNDNNAYILGRIGKHNVVIAALPDGQYGLVTAATVARDMVRSFPNVRIGLMVGIGGGAPSAHHDIRLGDVVVSSPGPGSGGVFQYDYGKTIQNSEFVITSHLNQPPQFILAAIATLKAQHKRRGHDIEQAIEDVLQNNRRLQKNYRKPDPSTDRLYTSTYLHAGTKEQECAAMCGATHLVERPERSEEEDSPTIHYGTIASANQLMKDANLRDKLSAENNVLCFEMEAAGLMNQFPCIVVRGICDFSDTHKNKVWQGYAAMAAAAYAKDLLRKVAPNKVEAEKRLAELLSNLSNELSETKSQVVQTRLILEKEEDLKVLNWLTPIDFGPQHSDYLRRRQPGTGQWLLDCEIYKRWIEEPGQKLFCPGIPGAGKTILSSIVIHDLKSRFSSDLATVVVYVYCNFNRQAEQRLEHLMSSLLKQLAHNSPSLPSVLHELYREHAKNQTTPTLGEISMALRTVITAFTRVFIVVDALDECQVADNCRTRFLHQLCSLQTQRGVSIFATSRHMPDIEKEFSDSLTIEIRASEEDIGRYLKSAILRLPRFVAERSDLQDEIMQTISRVVDGMFLLAQLYCDTLMDKDNPKLLRNALQDLATGSKSYEAAYDGAMTRIEGQLEGQAKRAKQVLAWITCAQRPLTKTELQHALAVEIGKTKLDKDNITQIHEMVSICAGLVTIDETSSVIRLVHYTTQKYFESTQGRWFPAAHSILAETCTTYLSFDAFADGRCQSDQEFEARLEEYRFFGYAASYWGHHARAAPGYEQVLGFLRKPAQIDASVQAYFIDTSTQWRYSGYSQGAPSGMVATHLAAIFGLATILPALWSKGNQDAKDSAGWTPLSRAAENGHTEVVQLLLETKEVDVNAQGGDYGSALHAASEGGYREIVQILIDNRADVNAQGGWYGNALQAASSGGHREIVQLLLEKGADVNAQGGFYGNALQAASYGGHREIVQLLLDKGADWTAEDNAGWTPLNAAASSGHLEVVKLLLEKGADWTAANNAGCTPFYSASIKGHTKVVRLLLENGADWAAADNTGRTPFNAAADNGHLEVVQLLLENGADWAAADNTGRTPFNAAADNGHLEVVQLLLEKGADWAAADNTGCTPFNAAASNGYLEVVKLLLEKGADISFPTKIGQTSVHTAAFGGHSDVIQLLFRHAADMRVLDIFGRPPFFYAIRGGDPTSFSILKVPEFLEPGFRDVYGSNALSVAVRCGHKDMIRDLISEQSLMVEDCFGRTPIWWAHKQGYMAMVEHIAAPPGLPGTSNLPTGPPVKFAREGGYCDVCLASWGETYYICMICCAGNFVVCSDCYDIGARCLAEDHTLTLSNR